MATMVDLLDVDTWARLKKAAPKVTQVPYDRAKATVRALGTFAGATPAHADLDEKKFWRATYKELLEAGKMEASPSDLGRALKTMGLVVWREDDGFHVAWSEEQLKILREYFKV